MNAAHVNSPSGQAVVVFVCIGFMVFTPDVAKAQATQQNTNAMQPVDWTAGAELFGGLEGKESDGGTTFAPESEGDADLGEQVIFQGPKQYEPLTISLLGQGVFTSNAGLTDTDEEEDFYLYSELDVRFIPQIGEGIFGNFTASYGAYRYNDNGSLDFDSLQVSMGLMRVFPQLNNLVAWANYDYTRLIEGRGGRDELLTDHSIELGLYYPVPISERHFAFGSYLSVFSLDGDPGSTQRDQHGLTLGYVFLPVDAVEFSAYYQFFVYDYHKDGRHDLFHDIGLGVTWELSDNFDVGLLASYSANDSNTSGGDYEVGEFGASLNATFRF